MQDKWDITQSSIQQFDHIEITNNNIYEHVLAESNTIDGFLCNVIAEMHAQPGGRKRDICHCLPAELTLGSVMLFRNPFCGCTDWSDAFMSPPLSLPPPRVHTLHFTNAGNIQHTPLQKYLLQEKTFIWLQWQGKCSQRYL